MKTRGAKTTKGKRVLCPKCRVEFWLTGYPMHWQKEHRGGKPPKPIPVERPPVDVVPASPRADSPPAPRAGGPLYGDPFKDKTAMAKREPEPTQPRASSTAAPAPQPKKKKADPDAEYLGDVADDEDDDDQEDDEDDDG